MRPYILAAAVALAVPSLGIAADDTCLSAPYYIQNVEASAVADTSEDARSAATAEGLMVAWQRLLDRLLITDDVSSADLSADDVLPYLDYTRLVQETVLPTRYQAVFDYCFDRLKVRDYFTTQNYRHAELLSESILLLPIWITPDGPYLWRKPNPWMSVWGDLLARHDGLLDIRLPIELATERAINPVPLMARDQATLARAAQLEATERVLLMVMTPKRNGTVISVDVTADLYDRNGAFQSTAYSLLDTALRNEDIISSIRGIARTLLDGVEDVWRNANEVNIKEKGVVMLTVQAPSLKEWRSHLDILQSLPPVDGVFIVQLTSKGGLVRIRLSGSIASLNYALDAYGLKVAEAREKSQTYLSLVRSID